MALEYHVQANVSANLPKMGDVEAIPLNFILVGVTVLFGLEFKYKP